MKADVSETRYAREPLHKRVQGDAAEQRNLVGPKQRGAGGRVRESRGLKSPLVLRRQF